MARGLSFTDHWSNIAKKAHFLIPVGISEQPLGWVWLRSWMAHILHTPSPAPMDLSNLSIAPNTSVRGGQSPGCSVNYRYTLGTADSLRIRCVVRLSMTRA